MNAQQTKQKGFTIIEVVLVLAIAGLIFLMVFIALPALQRNQRDTARKNDVSTIASAVTSYSSNNRGAFPTASQLDSYLNDLSDNTDKGSVTVSSVTTRPVNVAPADAAVTIVQKASCGASTNTNQEVKSGTSRQFVVVTKLESGNGQYFCQDS
jgi:prepilin-type N-terminal cleavage/methylation domain-containing protein